MRTMQAWTVSSAEHGCSLLDFLAEHLRISRRRAKALLDARSVFVNQRRVWMARHVLHRDDVVEAHGPEMIPSPSWSMPSILFDDEDFLIVNKPAGQTVDGPHGTEAQCRRVVGIPGLRLVHRLDRDTSGCLLLAKNPAAFDAMVALFEQRRVVKVYDVIVSGMFPERIRKITKDIDGQSAITHVMRISANPRASHLRVRIETGRTHQIRKHMAAQGHPVLGDRQYTAGPVLDPLLREVPRQMLHATQLAFSHPLSGRMVKVKAPLPADFIQELKKLRLT